MYKIRLAYICKCAFVRKEIIPGIISVLNMKRKMCLFYSFKRHLCYLKKQKAHVTI